MMQQMSNKPMRSHKDGDFATTLVRIVLQMANDENKELFSARLTDELPSGIQSQLYDFVRSLICSWAGNTDLSREDAAVIEDCRKICDVMGWRIKSQ